MRLGFLYGGSLHSACLEEFKSLVQYIRGYFLPSAVEISLFSPKQPEVNVSYYKTQFVQDPKELHDYVKKFDVTVAGQCLPNDVISGCKSFIKWIEWSLIGVPLIAPSIGQYAEVLEHKKDTLLYTNFQEFVVYLDILSRDPELRRQLVQNSLRKIYSYYTMEKVFGGIKPIMKAPKIVYYWYKCPWRVFEPIRWFQSIGKQVCYIEKKEDLLNCVDKSTLLYLLRVPMGDIDAVVDASKKAYFTVLDIDDLIWEKGNYYYQSSFEPFYRNAYQVVDMVTVSTNRLKGLVEDLTYHKVPVVVRENAVARLH